MAGRGEGTTRTVTRTVRRRRGGAFLAILAALAAACTAGEEEPPRQPLDDDRPLVVVGGADLTDQSGHDGMRQLIDLWNREHERPARLVQLSPDVDGQRSQLLAEVQSGSADFDVIVIDPPWIPEFAEAGLIEPLDDDLLEPDFLEEAERSAQWDGETYAVPFNVDVGLLYYRTDVLSRQGVQPEELRDAESLEALMTRFVRGTTLPAYITQLDRYEGLTVNTLEAFWSTDADGDGDGEAEGVRLVDDDGGWAGGEEELRAGLETLEHIADADNHKISQAAFEATETQALAEFIAEDAGTAMMRGWPDYYHRLPAGGGYGVTALPGVAALGGQSLALAAGSERQDDAQELIRFLSHNTANQRTLLETGTAPALRDAYALPEPERELCADRRLVGRPAEPEEETVEQQSAAATQAADQAEREFRHLVWCALQEARPRPSTQYYTAFSEALQREVYAMLTESDVGAAQAAGCLARLLPTALDGGRPPGPGEIPECDYQ